MNHRIHLSAPDIRGLEIPRVVAAIESNWVAPAGPEIELFEASIAAATGRAYAVAVSSGTAAMHLALLDAGVERGDIVVCPTFTFIGTVSPVVHLGATPVFLDSEETSWNLDPILLKAFLEEQHSLGASVGAVIAVDLYGVPADYRRLVEICAEFGVPLISDAAESLGSDHDLGPAGSFGKSAIVSFNGNKIITSSGGGAFLTDSAQAASRARYLSTQARQEARHYEHIEVGFNYRLSNICAAIGRAQLESLGDRVNRRLEIRQRYVDGLDRGSGLRVGPNSPHGSSNAWLTCVQLPSGSGNHAIPSDVVDRLEDVDIECRPAWKPMHLQPVFRRCKSIVTGVAEAVFTSTVCVPSGSGLADSEVDRVIDALNAFVGREPPRDS